MFHHFTKHLSSFKSLKSSSVFSSFHISSFIFNHGNINNSNTIIKKITEFPKEIQTKREQLQHLFEGHKNGNLDATFQLAMSYKKGEIKKHVEAVQTIINEATKSIASAKKPIADELVNKNKLKNIVDAPPSVFPPKTASVVREIQGLVKKQKSISITARRLQRDIDAGIGSDYIQFEQSYIRHKSSTQSNSNGNKDYYDNLECQRLLELCKSHHHPAACVVLGNLSIEEGNDYGKAIECYKSAKPNSDSYYNLGLIYSSGSPDGKIAKDEALSLKYFHSASDLGDKSAQVWLGEYYHSQGEFDKSIEYLKLAAKGPDPNPQALFFLSRIYSQGDGAERDGKLGFDYLKRAAELENDQALYLLGDYHYHGDNEFVEKNNKSALEFYKRAGILGNVEAMYNVGCMYFDGKGEIDGLIDYNEALKWYEKAAEFQHVGALLSLGNMYFHGFGVDECIDTAQRYKKMAEEIMASDNDNNNNTSNSNAVDADDVDADDDETEDEISRNIRSLKVHENYSAKLNQTELKDGKSMGTNKYYVVQILKTRPDVTGKDDKQEEEEEAEVEEYHLLTSWGRVGEVGKKTLRKVANVEEAIKLFHKKFREKTKNKWENRSSFVKHPGSYQFVETENRKNLNITENDDGFDVINDGIEDDVFDHLDDDGYDKDDDDDDSYQLRNSFITDDDTHQKDGNVVLGKLSVSQIEKGKSVLKQLKDIIISKQGQSADRADEIKKLSSQFYSLIPTNFGRRAPEPIADMDILQSKGALLEFWLRMGFDDVKEGKNQGGGGGGSGRSSTTSPLDGVMELPLPPSLHAAAGNVCSPQSIRSALSRASLLFSNQVGNPIQPMSEDLYGAILLYTGDSLYSYLNRALRSEKKQKIEKYHNYLRMLLDAMNCMSRERRTLWRGVSLDLYDHYKPDEIITWWSVSSATSDLFVAEEFMNSIDGKTTLFTIDCHTAVDISELSFNPYQREYLLAPGTQFKIISRSRNNNLNLTEIHLQEK